MTYPNLCFRVKSPGFNQCVEYIGKKRLSRIYYFQYDLIQCKCFVVLDIGDLEAEMIILYTRGG